MGKIARSKRKIKKAAAKRARKTANQEKYIAWAKAGENKKSKRFRGNRKKKRLVSRIPHPTPCGNFGCIKCYPRPRLRPRNTISFEKWYKNYLRELIKNDRKNISI